MFPAIEAMLKKVSQGESVPEPKLVNEVIQLLGILENAKAELNELKLLAEAMSNLLDDQEDILSHLSYPEHFGRISNVKNLNDDEIQEMVDEILGLELGAGQVLLLQAGDTSVFRLVDTADDSERIFVAKDIAEAALVSDKTLEEFLL